MSHPLEEVYREHELGITLMAIPKKSNNASAEVPGTSQRGLHFSHMVALIN